MILKNKTERVIPLLIKSGIFQETLLFVITLILVSTIQNKSDHDYQTLKTSVMLSYLPYTDDLKLYEKLLPEIELLLNHDQMYSQNIAIEFGWQMYHSHHEQGKIEKIERIKMPNEITLRVG